ncbi:enoyl-CoA hydratase-related protein [Rheinheimera sp.]|uniref:enoyl-CoA hydratase-related protein n=1 Tax=Rheinheimera sp. TaxID=1869214 RepID=UPI003AF606C2
MAIELTQQQGVLVLTLARLDKKNALSQQMYRDLVSALEQAQADPEVRVVLFQGSADCFSAGNDLVDFLGGGALNAEHPTVQFLQKLASFTKPMVAAVSGLAIGIGTTMLLHCDLVYASSPCRFQLPFTQLGLCPEAASSLLLPKLVGLQRASAMLLLSEAVTAEQALQMGMVNELVDAPKLLDYALGKALKLAALPADAVQTSRALMRQPAAVAGAIQAELQQFERLLGGPDCQQAVRSFLQKK